MKLSKKQAAIIGAYTGVTCGPFSDVHGYAQKVLGRPILTHQFADKAFMSELKAAAKPDFLSICHEESK